MKLMRLFILLLIGSTAFATTPAKYSQSVSSMEIAFRCHLLQPVMDQYAVNYRFQSGEERWQNPDSRLRVNGTHLELVGVNEERTVVIGTFELPTCQSDDLNSVDGTPSWNKLTLSPLVQVTAMTAAVPSSCKAEGNFFTRDDQYQIIVNSPLLPEEQNFSWSKKNVFITRQECERNS